MKYCVLTICLLLLVISCKKEDKGNQDRLPSRISLITTNNSIIKISYTGDHISTIVTKSNDFMDSTLFFYSNNELNSACSYIIHDYPVLVSVGNIPVRDLYVLNYSSKFIKEGNRIVSQIINRGIEGSANETFDYNFKNDTIITITWDKRGNDSIIYNCNKISKLIQERILHNAFYNYNFMTGQNYSVKKTNNLINPFYLIHKTLGFPYFSGLYYLNDQSCPEFISSYDLFPECIEEYQINDVNLLKTAKLEYITDSKERVISIKDPDNEQNVTIQYQIP